MTEEEFADRFGDTPLERPGLAGMRRNFRAAFASVGKTGGRNDRHLRASSLRRMGQPGDARSLQEDTPPRSLKWMAHIVAAEWLWLARCAGTTSDPFRSGLSST